MARNLQIRNPFLSQDEINERTKLQSFVLTGWNTAFRRSCLPGGLAVGLSTYLILIFLFGVGLTAALSSISIASWTTAGLLAAHNVRLSKGRIRLEELKKSPQSYTFNNQSVMDILKPLHFYLMKLPPAERVNHRQLWETALVLSKALEKDPKNQQLKDKLKLRRDAIEEVVIARNALERADREDRERMVRESMERDIEGLDNSDLLAARAEARALLAGADRLRAFSGELAN